MASVHCAHSRQHKYPPPPSLAELGLAETETQGKRKAGRDLTKLKKFRFQLLQDWLVDRFSPRRVADIGGGKGLLAYLLQQQGWEATVVDPQYQGLPAKYKDLDTGARIRIALEECVPRLDRSFEASLAGAFDLLVGLHAHGCNMRIIDAAREHGCGFALMPCCVIDEPAAPPPNVHWLPWLANYAVEQGLSVQFFCLNFKGQNIGFYHSGPADAQASASTA